MKFELEMFLHWTQVIIDVIEPVEEQGWSRGGAYGGGLFKKIRLGLYEMESQNRYLKTRLEGFGLDFIEEWPLMTLAPSDICLWFRRQPEGVWGNSRLFWAITGINKAVQERMGYKIVRMKDEEKIPRDMWDKLAFSYDTDKYTASGVVPPYRCDNCCKEGKD